MTTANLSVGIDTSEARASLQRLRAEMESQPHNLLVHFSTKDIDKEIAQYLDRRKFRITLGAANLHNIGKEIGDIVDGYLDRAITKADRVVGFNHAALTTQVRAAVEAGLNGGVLHLGGVAGATSAPAASQLAGTGIEVALKGAIAGALVPAVDELTKAALAITNVARKVGVSGVVEKFDPHGPDFSSLMNMRDEVKARQMRADQLDSNRTYRFRRNWASAGDGPRNQADNDRGQRASDWSKERARRRSLMLQEESEYAALQKAADDMAAGRADLAALKRKQSQIEYAALQKAADDAAAARAEVAVNRARNAAATAAAEARMTAESQADSNRIFRFRQNWGRADRLEGARLDRVQNREAWSMGPDRSTLLKLRDAAAATSRKEEEAATEAARKAADRLRAAHEKATGPVAAHAAAQRSLNQVMNEGHSAARGLAGSMGAMWATYGSVVPLVTAAAIGASLRSVISVGKDLEAQLTFVSALTDRSVVSTERLSQALAGSVVGPVQAAEAMRGLAQNGLNVNEAFTALPSILALATAGEMTLMEAALGATGVMASFNKTVSDLGQIGDVFAKAAAMSNTDVKGMVEAMKQASTVGDQFGVTMEETAASLAVMAKRNITGTSAGTAFRNMMKELASPTKAAKEAIDALGLKFFDANGKLLPLQDNLSQLKARLTTLNEESRLAFIERIFGERGGKAANAILSDLVAYNSALDTLKTKSQGFAQSVADAQATTTDGRIKLLFSEFQTSAALAFDSANGGVNNFIEAMRELIRSPEVKNGLSALISGVTTLTTFLIENGRAVATVISIWAGAKVLSLAATMLFGVSTAAGAASTGLVALGVAGRGALAAMSGGVSLLLALGIEFLVLARNTDQATEADRAQARAIENGNEAMTKRLAKMTEENELLARKNALMNQGKTEAEATSIIADESKKKDTVDLEARLARKQSELVKALERRGSDPNGAGYHLKNIQEVDRLQGEIAALQLERSNKESLKAKQGYADWANLEDKRLNAIQQFNQRVAEARAAGIKTGDIELPTALKDSRVSNDYFESVLSDANRALNKLKEAKSIPDPQAKSLARAVDKAEVRDAIQDIHDVEAALVQSAKFRKDLDNAKYNPNLFGQQIGAYLAEQRAIDFTTESLKLQADAVQKLRALQKLPNLNEADKKAIDTEVKKEQAKLDLGREALRNQRAIAEANSIERARQEAYDNKKTLSQLGVDDDKEIDKIRLSYSNKAVDPATAVSLSAQLAVQNRYAGEIQKYLDKTLETEAAIAQSKAIQAGLDGAELAREQGTMSVLEGNLALQQTRLAVLKAQASSAAALSGSVARTEFEKSQQAEYGWDKFWASYTSSAQSNAAIVEEVMKSTTSNMTGAFTQFTTTSDRNFRHFAANIATTAANMLANKAISQLLSLAVNFAVGSMGGSSTTMGQALPSGAGASTVGMSFADGGVMTPYGPLALRKYAKGGVAHSPQLSVHGEGSLPEANVPLPDGRTIPVTIKGSAGGGDVHVSLAVYIDSNGKSRVESDSSGEKAQQFGEVLADGVRAIIVEEKRPGGLLYA